MQLAPKTRNPPTDPYPRRMHSDVSGLHAHVDRTGTRHPLLYPPRLRVTRHGTSKTWWGRVAPGSMGHAAWDAPFPTVKVGDSEVAADRRGCVERRTQAQVRSRRATVSAPWGRDPALSFPCLAARCNGRMPNPASPYQLTVMTSMLALASTAPASPPDGAGTSMAPDFA